MDVDKAKNLHFIGIGGCGMSAIAKILWEMGKGVQGSDSKESSNTIRLRDLGMRVFIGHDGSNIRGSDLIVYSSAIPSDNVELSSARAAGLSLISRADALSWILDQFKTRITVAGTHGKTTTTSMISTLLSRCGLSPTYLIGAEADTVEGNARLGNGQIVVAEADESDGSFLKFHPTIAVVTNVESDHMDHYKTLENIIETFAEHLSALSSDGCLIINTDNSNNHVLLKKLGTLKKCVRYGMTDDAELKARDIKHDAGGVSFDILFKGKLLGRVEIAVPGLQNVQNALSSIAVGLELGLPFTSIRNAIRYFKGVKRRFQNVGEFNRVTVIDDYAHHPTEVAATLSAARAGWSSKTRIICVFQPHRYTRTLHLHTDFGSAFDEADVVILSDIYSAGEEPIEGVSTKLIEDAVRANSGPEVHYIPKKDRIVDFLLKFAKPGDMIITAGAGDIHSVGREYLARARGAGK